MKSMFWKRSFKRRMETINRFLSYVIKKLNSLQTDMSIQTEKNQAEVSKLLNENSELAIMKSKAAVKIQEIGKYCS